MKFINPIYQLPWPVSNNVYYRNMKKTILSPKAQAYHANVAAILSQYSYEPITYDVTARILAYQPDRRKRDIDNLLKCILDTCVKSLLILDDSQIKRLEVEMKPKDKAFKDGLVLVQFEKYEERKLAYPHYVNHFFPKIFG